MHRILRPRALAALAAVLAGAVVAACSEAPTSPTPAAAPNIRAVKVLTVDGDTATVYTNSTGGDHEEPADSTPCPAGTECRGPGIGGGGG
jgi:hypothetical protein